MRCKVSSVRKKKKKTAPSMKISHKKQGHMLDTCKKVLIDGDIPFLIAHTNYEEEDEK